MRIWRRFRLRRTKAAIARSISDSHSSKVDDKLHEQAMRLHALELEAYGYLKKRREP
jgi:hypothetical protein